MPTVLKNESRCGGSAPPPEIALRSRPPTFIRIGLKTARAARCTGSSRPARAAW